jgi:hypothetical protein
MRQALADVVQHCLESTFIADILYAKDPKQRDLWCATIRRGRQAGTGGDTTGILLKRQHFPSSTISGVSF